MNKNMSVTLVKFREANKIRISEKEAQRRLWIIKSLPIESGKEKFKGKTCDEGKSMLEKTMEESERKYKLIKVDFIADMNELISQRDTQIKLVTDILKSELNYLKDRLNNLKEENKEAIDELKNEWNEAISTWQIDMNAIEKETVSKVKEPIGLYIQKLILTRKHTEDIPDILMALILEINHIVIGNAQTVLDTRLHLSLLWENNYKQWKTDIIYDKLNQTEVIEISEDKSELTNEEIFTETIVQTQALLLHLNDKQNLQKETRKALSIKNYFHPILLQLENYREELKTALSGIINCLDSEVNNILLKKKNALDVSSSRKTFRDTINKERKEDELKSLETYETDLLSLTSSTKMLFNESSQLTKMTTDDWNKLVDVNLENVKNLFIKKLNKYKMEDDLGFSPISISLNIALDNLGSASSMGSLEDAWNALKKIYQDILMTSRQQYERKQQLLNEVKEINMKCFSIFIARVDYRSAVCDRFLSNFNMPIIYNSQSYPTTFVLALQNVIYWYKGYLRTLQFLRETIMLNISNLGNDWFLERMESQGYIENVKIERVHSRMTEARMAVYQTRVAELRNNRQDLMKHVKAIQGNLDDMKSIEKNFEEQVNTLDREYEQLYKELFVIRDLSGDTVFAKTLKLIHDVKAKFKSVQLRKIQMGSRVDQLIERRTEWMNNSNAYFLRRLRLLHEGGDCNSEEVTKALYAIGKYNADIQKENKNLKARLRKVLKAKIKDYTSRTEKIIKEIKSATQEEATKMKIKLRFERIKKEMKWEIICARERIANLERAIEGGKDSRNLSSWLNTIEEINKTLNYFNTGSSLVNKEETDFLSDVMMKQTIYKRKGSRRTPKRESFGFHRSSESSKQIAKSDNFWDRINIILHVGLEKIKAMIHSLQSKGHNQEGTQLSARQSREDVNKMVQSLKPKVDIVWMDMTIDLLTVVYSFKLDFKNILLKKCELYKTVSWEHLKEMERTYRRKMKLFEENVEQKLKKYSDSLKVIHGHPSQKKKMLLKKNEVLYYCEGCVANYKSNVELYRKRLKLFFDGYSNNFNLLRNEMCVLISGIQDNKVTDSCIRKIKQTSRLLSNPSKEHLHRRQSVKQLSSFESKDLSEPNRDNEDGEEEEESLDRACKNNNIKVLRQVVEFLSNKLIGTNDPFVIHKRRKSRIASDSSETTVSEDVVKKALNDYDKFMNRLKKELVNAARTISTKAVTDYEAFGNKVLLWYKQWSFSATEIEKLFVPYLSLFYFLFNNTLKTKCSSAVKNKRWDKPQWIRRRLCFPFSTP